MKMKILRAPFFLLLLPVFFVLHGFQENAEFIGYGDFILLLFIYCGAS